MNLRSKRVVAGVAFLALVLIARTGNAQEASKEQLLKELNRDIWIPFIEAYATDDAERYLKLHSQELVRGEGDAKRVLSLSQYAEGVRPSFLRRKERGAKTEIQFRFLERIVSPELASERGIYQLSITSQGEARKFYGKFHVIARKEAGAWKILVDYDSSEGRTIDEKSFQTAFAQDDYKKY